MPPHPVAAAALLLLQASVVSSWAPTPFGRGRRTALRASPSLGDKLRGDFPSLSIEAYPGVPLVYLDSAATSQKPRVVLDALTEYYESKNANVHRGAHALATRATEAYEGARASVATLVGAPAAEEIVFTRGATEAINLVANTWGVANLGPGDEIVSSCLEHHSNMVPWQLVAQRTGCTVKYARLDASGERLDVEHLESLITERTKLVAVAHVSNALGCINPVERIVAAAKGRSGGRAVVLLDACQSVPHMPVDVKALGVDFLAASGHKMCGPTGIGFLWGRADLLRAMPPWQGGGEMIDEVTLEGSTYADIPGRFEAGTPPIAQAVGMGAAAEYLMKVGMDNVERHEHALAAYLYTSLARIDGLRLYGPPPGEDGSGRAALVAFNDVGGGVHASDLAFFCDRDGVAIRAGHHCTQPLHRELGAAGSGRASLYLYNTEADVDALVASLTENLAMLRGSAADFAGVAE